MSGFPSSFLKRKRLHFVFIAASGIYYYQHYHEVVDDGEKINVNVRQAGRQANRQD